LPKAPQLFVPPQIYTRRIRLQSGKSTPPTRSGRGWPAGFISRNAYAVPTTCDRPIAVTNCVFAIAITLANHGWLTPAALGAQCSFAAKALFAMDKRTFTGAADVSPPWLGEPDAVPRESNIVQRLASTRSGAVGVSPPWLGERHAVPRESNIVQRLASTRSGAAGVSLPWLGNVLAVMNAVCERERSPTTAGLRQPLLIASGTPLQKCVSCRCNGYVHHGWLTPAALGARCSFAAKALFAMDKRTFTGAAGVSPPWLGNVLAVMNAVCERERSPTTAGLRQPLLIASRAPLQRCVSCRCNGCVHPGWLTPAALGAPRLIIAINAICTAHTQRHRSGGRTQC
jgi:hypothetical protein